MVLKKDIHINIAFKRGQPQLSNPARFEQDFKKVGQWVSVVVLVHTLCPVQRAVGGGSCATVGGIEGGG